MLQRCCPLITSGSCVYKIAGSWLCWCIFLTSIITTALPQHMLIIIISFLFVSSYIAFVTLQTYWVLGSSFSFFFLFCFFFVQVIFYKINECAYVELGVLRRHFLFIFYLKGQVFLIFVRLWVDILEVSSKFDKKKKIFSISFQLIFFYFLSVGIKLRFLFKSLKVSEENERSDKFITFPHGSGLYLILLLIARCMLIVFPLFVG